MIFIDKNNRLNLSRLHRNQKRFVRSTKLHTGIVGGYQSGKSVAAVVKCITHLLRFPGIPIAYYLPTFSLFDNMLVPKIDSLFEKIGISYVYNKNESKIITKSPELGEIWMRSMSEPDRIVSYSVGYSVIDEIDVVHINKRADAVRRITARNSLKKGESNQVDYVCTPEGYAYMYDFFVKKHNKNKLLLELDTYDNEYNLAGGYIDGLKEQYTEEELDGYLRGKFVSLNSSRSYYKFDRYLNNSNETAKEFSPLYIGMDFNVGNMSAVIHIKKNGNPIAVDEITGAYDTEEMIYLIKDKYLKNDIIIYPDATGKRRYTTDATKTDIGLLKKAGFIVCAKDSNPSQKDRVKNMNRMFCNAHNERKYLVNIEKCLEYTEALERITNDKNGIPDKTSGFDHITEAAGYFIYYDYPINKTGSFINF